MTTLQNIIEEAMRPEKQFESEEQLLGKVKSILRKVSFPKAKESKSRTEKGFQQQSQFGYTYRYFNGSVTISFVGAEVRWISELMKALTTEKINYHFNKTTEVFLIKTDENIKLEKESYPEEVQEEMNQNTYNVLNVTVNSKINIKTTIDGFNTVQKKIYNFLNNEELIEWNFVKQHNKYVYQLKLKESK